MVMVLEILVENKHIKNKTTGNLKNTTKYKNTAENQEKYNLEVVELIK